MVRFVTMNKDEDMVLTSEDDGRMRLWAISSESGEIKIEGGGIKLVGGN